MDTAWKVFIALAPSVGILFIFYHVMRSVLEGDRRERLAQAQWEKANPVAADPTSGHSAE